VRQDPLAPPLASPTGRPRRHRISFTVRRRRPLPGGYLLFYAGSRARARGPASHWHGSRVTLAHALPLSAVMAQSTPAQRPGHLGRPRPAGDDSSKLGRLPQRRAVQGGMDGGFQQVRRSLRSPTPFPV